MSESAKNKIIIISGPSGVGKSTAVKALLRRRSDLERVITYTTRQPRPGEVNGRDYYFVSQTEFIKKIKAGELLEYAKVHNHYYGTPRSRVEKILKAGRQPVLVVDVQGAASVKSKFNRNRLKLIFILPETKKELRQRIMRRTTSENNSHDLRLRLANAEREMRAAEMYDYRIINKTNYLDETIKSINAAIDEGGNL
jgi:guanylate kinase